MLKIYILRRKPPPKVNIYERLQNTDRAWERNYCVISVFLNERTFPWHFVEI